MTGWYFPTTVYSTCIEGTQMKRCVCQEASISTLSLNASSRWSKVVHRHFMISASSFVCTLHTSVT